MEQEPSAIAAKKRLLNVICPRTGNPKDEHSGFYLTLLRESQQWQAWISACIILDFIACCVLFGFSLLASKVGFVLSIAYAVLFHELRFLFYSKKPITALMLSAVILLLLWFISLPPFPL